MSCVVAAAALGFLAVMVFVGGQAWRWLVLRWGAALWVWAGLAGGGWLVTAWLVRIELAAEQGRKGPVFGGLVLAVAVASVLTLVSGVGAWRALRERRDVRVAFPHREGGERFGTFVVAGESVTIRLLRENRRGWSRWDGCGVVLRCRVAPETVSLGLPEPGWHGLVPAPLVRRRGAGDGGLGGRVWLDEVTIPPGGSLRIVDGVVEVRPDGWLTARSLAAAVEEMAGVVATLRRSFAGAPARFVELATRSPDPAARRQAWLDLETLAADELRSVAPAGLADPDPVIRSVAAVAVNDAAVLEALLRSSDAAPAVLRAIRWALREARRDLAPVLAARLGTPPEEAWPELVVALGSLGGREEVEALHAVREGEGFPKRLRWSADEAMIAIRHRLGPAEAGRVAVADAVGGEVGLAGESGALGLVGSRLSGSATGDDRR